MRRAGRPRPPAGDRAELAALLWLEALFRRFDNRRQIAAYAGLTPSPWQSGGIGFCQGSRQQV